MGDKKICILHDTFLYKGGGERLILMMGKALRADIASGFFSAGSFDLRKEGFEGKMISLSSEIYKKGLRHLKLKFAFLFRTKFLRSYDIVLFSGDSISGVRNCHPDSLKVYYCHTPPRYIYDLHSLYKSKLSGFQKVFFVLGCKIFRFLYERDIKKMDIILTNSKNTQARIQKYLGLSSMVVYPPVERSKFQYIDDKNYFLSFARLADAKRVDMIVEAFRKLPQEKLIVIYGKNDPQREKILTLAMGYKQIECITLDDNDELYSYIGNARATIYIPVEEDFGMSPVESMSAGKPVLGVHEGGLKESIVHTETGYLLESDFSVDDIVSAIGYFSPERCRSMKENCQKQAENFSLENFEYILHDILEKSYNKKKYT
ncbi:glycosyltransferase [Candidatus Gracilibacteria bacterium]|nr:glycosyltransferase [Candidatus Gracilibacteria bacterium]